jgi:hypothetical protein
MRLDAYPQVIVQGDHADHDHVQHAGESLFCVSTEAPVGCPQRVPSALQRGSAPAHCRTRRIEAGPQVAVQMDQPDQPHWHCGVLVVYLGAAAVDPLVVVVDRGVVSAAAVVEPRVVVEGGEVAMWHVG